MRQATPVKRKPRAPKNRIEAPLSQAAAYSNEDFHQKVAELAYQLYLARGCAHGYDLEDWLAAEQIIKGA
jgi:hypothetical protein